MAYKTVSSFVSGGFEYSIQLQVPLECTIYYYWGEGDKKAVNNGMSTHIKKTEGKICTI